MNGNIQNLNIAGYRCLLYLPQGYYTNDDGYPVIYINGEDDVQEIMELMESHFGIDCSPFIVLSILSENWNNDFTPWPAPPLTKKSEPFTGGADCYLHNLVNFIKPYIDEHYKTRPEPLHSALIGYSLGGLTALYAIYKTGVFGNIGSISGSLWYAGWLEFMDSHKPVNSKVYMSLGKGENLSRNKVMAQVGNCTQNAFLVLKDQLESEKNIMLEWNDGGHFNEIPKRFEKAMLKLLQIKIT